MEVEEAPWSIATGKVAWDGLGLGLGVGLTATTVVAG